MTRRLPVFAIASLLAVAGADAFAYSDDEPLSMQWEDVVPVREANKTSSAPADPVYGAGCRLAVRSLEDGRRNKQTVGAVQIVLPAGATGTPFIVGSLLSGDGLVWLKGSTAAFRRFGFEVGDGAASGPRVVPVDLVLRLAHAWNAGFSLNAHVVVEARFPGVEGSVGRRYHGLGTKTNWVGANGEYMTVLNQALGEALREVAVDAGAVCAGRGPRTD